jgi:PKD repeat protein
MGGLTVAWGLLALVIMSGCLGRSGNHPPAADIAALPREGYAPLSVTFDASGTWDQDGDSFSCRWTFGDGKTASGRTVTHSFSEGTYEVALRAVDSRGGVGTANVTIVARAVPDGYVARCYEWIHKGEDQVWDALLPYNLYQMYRARIRTPFAERYDYPAYVLDPLDDPTLEDLATVLWGMADGRADAFVEWVLSFVQGAIRYVADPAGAEWPLYPIETLYDAAGDCEDSAILFVSLLRAKGVSSYLATVDTDRDGFPDHVLAFVPLSAEEAAELSCSGGVALTILEIEGDLCALAETACAEGMTLGLGCDPWGLRAEDVIQWWSF